MAQTKYLTSSQTEITAIDNTTHPVLSCLVEQ